jgi:hypothetical protein
MNFTHENEQTVRKYRVFYYSVFSFVVRHLVNLLYLRLFEYFPSSAITEIHFAYFQIGPIPVPSLQFGGLIGCQRKFCCQPGRCGQLY